MMENEELIQVPVLAIDPAKLPRKQEVWFLKSEIKRMLSELGVSRGVFKKTLPKMRGAGYKYKVHVKGMDGEAGAKPSLRQQYAFLKELKESIDNKQFSIEEAEENENEK